MSKFDRVDNLFVFGLPEVESLPELKKAVDELFNFLVGRSVPLRDLFRLGRRVRTADSSSPICPRPVLLKLMSSWDRRLVMSAVRMLKGYRLNGIFVREDLSPEERRLLSLSLKATWLFRLVLLMRSCTVVYLIVS